MSTIEDTALKIETKLLTFIDNCLDDFGSIEQVAFVYHSDPDKLLCTRITPIFSEDLTREEMRQKIVDCIKENNAFGYAFISEAYIKGVTDPATYRHGQIATDPTAKEAVIFVSQHLYINNGESRVRVGLLNKTRNGQPFLKKWIISFFPKGEECGFFGDLLSENQPN